MIRSNLALSLCALSLLSIAGCERAPKTNPAPATSEVTSEGGGTVSFKVNGEQPLEFAVDDVQEGESLEAVMRRAQDVDITIQGSGVTAFVDQIGEQGTGSTEGWTFTVDGEFATKGIGSIELSPPTTIEWTFGSMPETP